jgi:hypothetical protein
VRGDKRKMPNAIQHGVFSGTAILPGEDPKEFAALFYNLIVEWEPDGPTEEDAVLSLAKCMWRKRRAQKFIELKLSVNTNNPLHPSYDPYTALSSVAKTLRANPDLPSFEVFANRFLYANVVKDLARKFPKSNFKSTREWADAVCKEIESVLMPKIDFRDHPENENVRLSRSSETFTEDFIDNELRLDERLDVMADRAAKRLIQTKAMKRMLGLTVPEQSDDKVRKIAGKKASNG